MTKACMTIVCLLLFFDLKSSIGQTQRTLDICSTPEIAAVPYEAVRFELQRAYDEQSCSLRINIPKGSWIRLMTTGYNIQHTTSRLQCGPDEWPYRGDNYVEVMYPGSLPKYYCGSSDTSSEIFTTYSRTNSQVAVSSISYSLLQGFLWRRRYMYFQMDSTVARVVFPGRNVKSHEDVKMEDQIVSHSQYGYTHEHTYPANINSTLALTGFEIGSTVVLKIRDFDVDSACNDYLHIEGLSYKMSSQIIICNRSTLLYNTIAIARNVSFNFVTDDLDDGSGFHIEYKITSTGCDPDPIKFAAIEYDAALSEFAAVCKDGHWFIDIEKRVKTITCNLTDSAWSDTTACTDINECLISNGGCSDVCNNTEGSYLCTCSDLSASLLSDGITCSSPDASGIGSGGKLTKAKDHLVLVASVVPASVMIGVIALSVGIIVQRKRRATASATNLSDTPIESAAYCNIPSLGAHPMAGTSSSASPRNPHMTQNDPVPLSLEKPLYEQLLLSGVNHDHEYSRPTITNTVRPADEPYEELNLRDVGSSGRVYASLSIDNQQVYVNCDGLD